jgi:hypothetical protein
VIQIVDLSLGFLPAECDRHRDDAFRFDAFPPWTDPDTWWYHCDVCGGRLTGAEIKASPIIHIVSTLGGLTSTGQP